MNESEARRSLHEKYIVSPSFYAKFVKEASAELLDQMHLSITTPIDLSILFLDGARMFVLKHMKEDFAIYINDAQILHLDLKKVMEMIKDGLYDNMQMAENARAESAEKKAKYVRLTCDMYIKRLEEDGYARCSVCNKENAIEGLQRDGKEYCEEHAPKGNSNVR